MDPDPSRKQILEKWASGQRPGASELELLATWELAAARRARAFGITPENAREAIAERGYLFEAVNWFGFARSETFLETLWILWLPLAIALSKRQQELGRPLIQGIVGGQGTGKTTMTKILSLILSCQSDRSYSPPDSGPPYPGLPYAPRPYASRRVLSLSIDDLYKTYSDRQNLQKQDPRLVWRGPPGTHDIELGIETLDLLLSVSPQSDPIPVPRFDKSAWGGAGDRAEPEIVERADIILFEGWFVGVRPIEPANFDTAPAPIITESDRAFARDSNRRLQAYLPLWQRLDSLIVLYPTDYRLSVQWRQQAEREMVAAGKSGMSDEQIEEFVRYFWQALHPELFIAPLVNNPDRADLVVEINGDRTIREIYRPGDS
ncbi:MAG: glycerate kinase [Oscillatoria sp. SIO1A7]|nr:glycerate kinase [Oscillatoria sp. SIO1A7]